MMQNGRNNVWPGVNPASPVNGALNLVSIVLAIGSAVVVAPLVYHPTIDYVREWIGLQYGREYLGFGSFVYSLLLWSIIFGLSRIFWLFLVMAIVAATVSLSYRFLPAMAL